MGDAGSRDRDSIGPVGPDDRGCAGCGSDMSKHVASAASLCVLVGFGVKFLRRLQIDAESSEYKNCRYNF